METRFFIFFHFSMLRYLRFRKVTLTQGAYESNIQIKIKQAHPITNLMSLTIENVVCVCVCVCENNLVACQL
jgi:hypothetical protein